MWWAPTQKHSRAISNTHTHLQCTQLVDIAASCPGVDTPLPLSDTFLRIFDRIFRRIFSKWAQLTWARALQRLVLETWYAREIDPWTRKHCQKQNRQITFWDGDDSESVSQNAGKENSAAIVSGSRIPVLPFKLGQKILPLKKWNIFPHHTILTHYLRKQIDKGTRAALTLSYISRTKRWDWWTCVKFQLLSDQRTFYLHFDQRRPGGPSGKN